MPEIFWAILILNETCGCWNSFWVVCRNLGLQISTCAQYGWSGASVLIVIDLESGPTLLIYIRSIFQCANPLHNSRKQENAHLDMCILLKWRSLFFQRSQSHHVLEMVESYHFLLIIKILEPRADTSSNKVHFEQISHVFMSGNLSSSVSALSLTLLNIEIRWFNPPTTSLLMQLSMRNFLLIFENYTEASF